MGENEKKLLELQDAANWSVPASLTAAVSALEEIETEYKKIASQNGEMKGKAAEAASDNLDKDRKSVTDFSDALTPLDTLIAKANRAVDSARKAYDDLPDATIDTATRIKITAGSFLFGPIVPLAAQAGMEAYEAWLRQQREDKAKEAVADLHDSLSDDSGSAKEIRGSMPTIRNNVKGSDEPGPIDWKPTAPIPGSTPAPAAPAPAPAPTGMTTTGQSADSFVALTPTEGFPPPPKKPWPPVIDDSHSGDDDTDTDDTDSTDTSVDGNVGTGHVSTGTGTTGSGTLTNGDGSSSHGATGGAHARNSGLSVDSGMSGVAGGAAGAAGLAGGSRLAGRLAAKSANDAAAAARGGAAGGGGLAGSVGGGLGGGSGAGAGSSGSTSGIGGRSSAAAGAGARAAAAAEGAEARSGTAGRPGASVMSPGGGAGGSEGKKRAGGLLGFKAPSLDDDGDPRARSSAAGPGGRGAAAADEGGE